jgi:hypothetical protein
MIAEFRRGDTLMITDGPVAALVRDGAFRITHRSAALARGYWEPTDEPLPPALPTELGGQLAAMRTQIEADEPQS